MSYAGTVFDMIRRNKENREALNLRRQRMNDLRKRLNGTGRLHVNRVTLEELEKIEREVKEKGKEERKYYLCAVLLLVGIGGTICLLLLFLFS